MKVHEIKDNQKSEGARRCAGVVLEVQAFEQTENDFQKEEEMKERVDTDIKEKDKQISKWKAEYKMLKIKF